VAAAAPADGVSPPAEEQGSRRGRDDLASDDDAPDAPAPKRRLHRAAPFGQSGRHGVNELTGRGISTSTPWLKWRARLALSSRTILDLGHFTTADDAARAYDAEVRRRGWVHVKPLNFPQPEELAAHPHQAGERCDERGLPLSLAPEPRVIDQCPVAAQGASNHRKPGKSGFFGVAKTHAKNKTTQWMTQMCVPGSANTQYIVGYFGTKEEAARAFDAEVRRRGWTHLKRLNFPDPADDGALPPSSAAAGAPGPGPD